MEFWRLTPPQYDSDYHHSYINGSLEHPFGLPGVNCEVCGQTWGGIRILPFECPPALRKRKHLKEAWPIAREQHKTLQQKVRAELHKKGITVSELRPGDDFQPCYLDVPSSPRADFLWSGLGSVAVSQRVRDLFEKLRIHDAVFCEVILRKVGKRKATLPPPMPSTGEPEDVINEVPLLSRLDAVGLYYEMVLLTESAYPPGGEPVSLCSGCGRETIDYKKRKLVMLPSMWKGAEIFFLATTLHIVITARLRQSLQKLEVTNVEFQKFGPG
jgi:hypothetical protein